VGSHCREQGEKRDQRRATLVDSHLQEAPEHAWRT
jgi:hypothetical protein